MLKPIPPCADRALQNRAFLGVILMLVGLALYPLSDAFIKYLMGTYSVPQTTFLRAFTRVIPLLMATWFLGGPRHALSIQQPLCFCIRLLINLAYTYIFMYAYSMGSLTVVYTLSYTSPFFLILLSSMILKEKISRERFAAVAIGMIGVIITISQDFKALEVPALLVLIGTFLGTLNKILIRRLASTEHSLAIAIYPNLLLIAVTLPFLFSLWQPMPWTHWGLFAIVGLVTAAGQYAIAQAFRYAQASNLAPLDNSTFFWVVALDYLWWSDLPSLATLIGVAIIVSSNLFMIYRTRRNELKSAAL